MTTRGAGAARRAVLGLLEDIKSHPEDGPRLILADWLDEHGEPGRAEFIRAQVELARREADDPERAALAARAWEHARPHRDEWLGPLKALDDRCRFSRGLLRIEGDADTVLGQEVSAAARGEVFDWVEGLDLDLHGASPRLFAAL